MEKSKEQQRLEESFQRFSEFLKPKEEQPKNPFEDLFSEAFKKMNPEGK